MGSRRGIKQASFAGGEIAPELFARSDIQRYQSSLRRMENWLATKSGGARRRTGLEYLGAVKTASERVRLIPFRFNEAQSYNLEFGNLYIRFWRDSAAIEDPASPGNPLEIVSPYATADLPKLHFAQSNDILFLTHNDGSFPPYELRRVADDNWSIVPYETGRTVNPPTTLLLPVGYAVAGPTTPVEEFDYVVCAVNAKGRRSLPSVPLERADAVRYTSAIRAQISWTAPAEGDTPAFYDVFGGRDGVYGYLGSTESLTYEDKYFAPDFSDQPPEDIDPFLVTASGGDTALNVAPTAGVSIKTQPDEAFQKMYTWHVEVQVSPGKSVAITFESRPTGGGLWNIDGTFTLFIGVGAGYSFDKLIVRTFEVDPAVADHEFRITAIGSGSATFTNLTWTEASASSDILAYPSTLAFYEQRLGFGGFPDADPAGVKLSQSGDFRNFDRAAPALDSDSIELSLASLRLDQIRGLVPLDALVVFTAGAEWVLLAGDGVAVSPSSFQAKVMSHYGASFVQPLVVGRSALFVADRDRTVREFSFDRAVGAGPGAELTILAPHLLETYDLEEWAYAQSPDSVVYGIRGDGTLLGLTLVKEQDVWGWHRHTSAASGVFESVCAIPEDGEFGVYVAIKRTINGATVRYIERFGTTRPASAREAVHNDSAITYDGRNTDGTKGWTILFDASGYSNNDSVECTGTLITTSDGVAVGQQLRIRLGGVEYQFNITSIDTTGPTVNSITGTAQQDVPTAATGVASFDWGLAIDTMTGLTHLEGEIVRPLVDGNDGGEFTVASGQITGILAFGEVIVCGLPLTSDLEMLPLFIPERDSRGRMVKKIPMETAIEVTDFRGLQVGQSFDKLYEMAQRNVSEGYGTPETATDSLTLTGIESTWDHRASLVIRQVAPLPVTLLSLIVDAEYSDG